MDLRNRSVFVCAHVCVRARVRIFVKESERASENVARWFDVNWGKGETAAQL